MGEEESKNLKVKGEGKEGPMQRTRACLIGIILGACFFSSCATSPLTYQGASTGGAFGAAAGAMIDVNNPWRGAVIGGLLGAALGGTLTEISVRAAREAAHTGRPVAYQRQNGWERVEAYPVGYNPQTKCHKVQERIWKDGELVKDQITEVCTGERTEYRY